MTQFFVPGIPRPQGSKKHIGNGRMIEANKNLKPWRETVKLVARTTHYQTKGAQPLDGPLHLQTLFILPRPTTAKNRPLPHTKPDLDKLLRAIGDALEQSEIITNDSRITTINARKRYPHTGEQTGVWIQLTKDTP